MCYVICGLKKHHKNYHEKEFPYFPKQSSMLANLPSTTVLKVINGIPSMLNGGE
jgi:hypothetical protein